MAIDKSNILSFRNIFILGLLVSLGVTFSEVVRGEHLNFLIFQNSTLDFWKGINPYGPDWFRHGLDYFLYAPPFSVLFAPFAYVPGWTGPFAWNLFNYLLYAYAIYTLPRFNARTKCYILLYTIPILAPGQMSFQYNITVAAMYLIAFSLMERNKAPWAVLVIMISALTKIYGLFELAILLFYPKFWRNIGYALLFGMVIALLPLLKLAPGELMPYYGTWIDALGSHKDTRVWETFFSIKILWGGIAPSYATYIQMGVLAWLGGLLFACRRFWNDFSFRAGALGILMGWIILFSNAAEKHTYIIALAGFLLWYWPRRERTVPDKILYWANFAILVLMPIDLLCPPAVMRFFFDTLDANQWLFIFTWLVMICKTMIIPLARRGQTLEQKLI